MPDYSASGHSGTGINKNAAAEPIRHRDKGTQSGTPECSVPDGDTGYRKAYAGGIGLADAQP